MRAAPRAVAELLFRHDAPIQSLLLAIRGLVLDELAPCHEHAFAMGSRVVLVYATSPRVLKDCVCSLAVYRRHVNLGFPYGNDLRDAAGLLKGTGKRWRHVSLKSIAELEQPGIRHLVREARRLAGHERGRGGGAEVITTVKQKQSATIARRPTPPW
jgi:hypothetical protein